MSEDNIAATIKLYTPRNLSGIETELLTMLHDTLYRVQTSK